MEMHPVLPPFVAVSAFFMILIMIFFAPTGPSRLMRGQVTRIDEFDVKGGRQRDLIVATADGLVRVRLPAGVDCRGSDAVILRRAQHLLGPRYILESGRCVVAEAGR
jgi:hypothetical protein